MALSLIVTDSILLLLTAADMTHSAPILIKFIRRPEIGEVYHTLVKAVDDEKLRAAKLALDHRAIETDLLDFPPHVRDTLRRGLKFEPEQHEGWFGSSPSS